MIGTGYQGVAQEIANAQELHELALDISKRHNLANEIAISLHLRGVFTVPRKVWIQSESIMKKS